MVVHGATLATRYAARFAEGFRLSKYTVGFIIVACISILPETFIAINASLAGVPSFGFGTLLGSNVADLTLVFAAIIFFAGRGLKIEGKILKNHVVYPFILLVPLMLGLNGHFSRREGLALIIAGGVFYYLAFKNGGTDVTPLDTAHGRKNIPLLAMSMAILLIGSHFTVVSGVALAHSFGVNSILVGMLVVGLGTTMPELFFAIKSARKRDDSLAIGDILGTVLADATIVVGLLALIDPFTFPQKIIYITGVFMVAASFLLLHFMKTGKTLTKREAYLLFSFWIVFVLIEFFANT